MLTNIEIPVSIVEGWKLKKGRLSYTQPLRNPKYACHSASYRSKFCGNIPTKFDLPGSDVPRPEFQPSTA